MQALSIFLFTLIVMGANDSTIRGKVTMPGRDYRDAVVYLEGVPGSFKAPAAPVQVDQKGKVFIPHVLPVVLGTTVEFLNSDDFLHNVFTPSKADKFNLGNWSKGVGKKYTFNKLGEVVLLCNLHPEMEAWVIVLPNPYFAKTDASGSFAIDNVPPGKYTVKVWQKRYRTAPQPVTVPASGAVEVNFTLAK